MDTPDGSHQTPTPETTGKMAGPERIIVIALIIVAAIAVAGATPSRRALTGVLAQLMFRINK